MNRVYLVSPLLLAFVFLIELVIASVFAIEVSAQSDTDRSGQALIFPTNRPIKGRVIDENGLPIIGAIVSHFGDSKELHSNHGSGPFQFANSTTTDLFGNFELNELNPRRCRVCIFHPDYQTRWASPVYLYSDIVLEKTRSVSGRILDHQGNPVKGARFRPNLVGGDIGFEPPEYLSDADGQVVLKGISRGEGGSYFFVEAETKSGPFKARFVWFEGKARSTWEMTQPLGTLEGEGDDFEVSLPKPDPVTLELVEQESGQPVTIDSAELWVIKTRDHLKQWIQDDLTIKGNQVKFGFLRPGFNFIHVKMKPEAMFPDRLVVIERNANSTPLDHQRIEVARGVKLKGRVVEKSNGNPIADAAIAYRPTDPAAQLRNGVVTPKFVRSDENGNYELLVPAVEARLRIAGECGPFRTPPVENGISSGGSSIERSKSIGDFEIHIDPTVGETIKLDAFELERSKVIRGTVVDLKGTPVNDAEFLVFPSRYQYNQSPKYGNTNEQGKFELDDVFTNALTDLHGYDGQRAVLFWDRDRTLIGRAEFSEKTDSELEVVLKPANAVLGRVIDRITQKPIAGALVIAGTGGQLEIAAKTAKDGTFLLEFISKKNSSFSVSYPGYQRHYTKVEIDPQQLLKEIDDIEITAYNAYGLPERVPDVADKSIDDALSVLNGYLETELNRIPETPKDYDWNSAEPQFLFKSRVADELNGNVEKMLKQFKQPADRVRLALLVFERLSQDRASKKIPYSATTRLLYKEVILKNLDNPVVLEATKKYELTWSGTTDASIVLSNNRSDAAKLWAVRKLLANNSSLLMGLRGPKQRSDESFESTFQDMKQAWAMGLSQFSEETYSDYPPGMEVTESQRLRSVVENQIKQIQQRLSEPGLDKARAAKVQALIDSLTKELP